MRNNSVKKILIIITLVFLTFCVVTPLLFNYGELRLLFWLAIGFGSLSYVITVISLILTDFKSNGNMTEVNYISVYFSLIYFFVSIIFNFLYYLRFSFWLLPLVSNMSYVIPILANLLFTIAFVSIRMFNGNYSNRLAVQTNTINQMTQPISAVSGQLGALLAMVKDEQLQKQIRQLKEMVDYSPNLSQSFSRENEVKFLETLGDIQQMILGNQDLEEISKKIEEAGQIWQLRNNLITTIR